MNSESETMFNIAFIENEEFGEEKTPNCTLKYKSGQCNSIQNTVSSKSEEDVRSSFKKSTIKNRSENYENADSRYLHNTVAIRIDEIISGGHVTELASVTDMDYLDEENEVYFLCGMCRKWFSNKSSMTIHFLGHFQDCPCCETCGESFTEPQDFADHCIKHVAYTCFICERPFFKKEDFEEHKLIHNLVCFKCKKTFLSESELQAHYSVHEEIVNVQCKVCHNYYSTKRSLRYHMASQHSIHSKLYPCALCNDKFTSSGNLNRHVLIYHKNIKPYVCHLCGKGYNVKGSLTTHLLHHKGEKPYTCLVCCRSFADVRQFKRHGVEHIPVETDPCEICGKVFQTAMKLKIHFRSHTNQGSFQCKLCPRRYNYSSHLRRHIMAHNDDRPFDCEVCGKCFIVRSELRKHLKRKHDYNQARIEKAIADVIALDKRIGETIKGSQNLVDEDDSTVEDEILNDIDDAATEDLVINE